MRPTSPSPAKRSCSLRQTRPGRRRRRVRNRRQAEAGWSGRPLGPPVAQPIDRTWFNCDQSPQLWVIQVLDPSQFITCCWNVPFRFEFLSRDGLRGEMECLTRQIACDTPTVALLWQKTRSIGKPELCGSKWSCGGYAGPRGAKRIMQNCQHHYIQSPAALQFRYSACR
jgi:hypothetical protein